jgi:hypothetical protein
MATSSLLACNDLRRSAQKGHWRKIEIAAATQIWPLPQSGESPSSRYDEPCIFWVEICNLMQVKLYHVTQNFQFKTNA